MNVLLDNEITDQALDFCPLGSALVFVVGEDPEVWIKQGADAWYYTSQSKFVSVVSTLAIQNFRSQRCALFYN